MYWVLRLYPRVWRERYQDEILEVLDQHRVSLRTLLDLVFGAIDANLQYGELTRGVVNLVKRLGLAACALALGWVTYGNLALADNTTFGQNVATAIDVQQIQGNIASGNVLPVHRIPSLNYQPNSSN